MWLAQPGASTEGSKLDHPEPPKSASPGSKMGSWRSPPKSSLGGSAAPPQRRQESFREDILGATFATHARSMRNDETWFKNQHVWSALNRFRIDPGSLQIDRGTRIEPGIGHAVGPLARRICGFIMVSCREAASERPASSPAGKYLWGDRTSVHASAHLSR